MLTARQLLIIGTKDSKQQKLRVEEIIRDLPNYSQETRNRLTHELLIFASNKSERLALRSQAVYILGLSSRALNIIGRIDVSNSLLKVIDDNFFTEDKLATTRQDYNCAECESNKIIFLRGLLMAIILIHPRQDWVIPRKIYKLKLLEGIDVNAWFSEVLKGRDKNEG